MTSHLDRICRDFLWEEWRDKRKFLLLKCCKVIELKDEGGLGLGDLEIENWERLNRGGDLRRKERLCREELLLQNMVRRVGLGSW